LFIELHSPTFTSIRKKSSIGKKSQGHQWFLLSFHSTNDMKISCAETTSSQHPQLI
jgi:hypothetical protein